MKKIYLLFTFVISVISYSQNCDIGNKNLIGDSNFANNYLLGIKYNITTESTLYSLNLVGMGTNSGVQMALYSDNNGVPNNLIVKSDFTNVINGVTTLPVTPTLLEPGDYWIMAVYENDGSHSNRQDDYSQSVYYTTLPYGNEIPTNASNFFKYTGETFNYFLGLNCGNTLSTSDFEINKFKLYPNPAIDFINIDGIEEPTKYEIYNTLGILIKRGTIHKNQPISTQDLQSGVYMMNIENNGSYKFIIK